MKLAAIEGKKRNVTLIAGVNCIDGYVICSDSQETVGDMRAPAEKLSIWTEGNFEVAIAGSGNNGELIDEFEERFRDELSHNKSVSSLKTLKDLFHVEFQQFQATEAASHTKAERRMRFVIAARLLATGEQALWSSRGSRLKAVDQYALVGFWDERYKFAVEGYLKPNPIPTIAARNLSWVVRNVAWRTDKQLHQVSSSRCRNQELVNPSRESKKNRRSIREGKAIQRPVRQTVSRLSRYRPPARGICS